MSIHIHVYHKFMKWKTNEQKTPNKLLSPHKVGSGCANEDRYGQIQTTHAP